MRKKYNLEGHEMTMGDRLRAARLERGLTQKALAKLAGISQVTVSDLERGRNAGSSEAASLAAVLGLNALWLSDGKGSKHGKDYFAQVPPDRRIDSNLMIAVCHAVDAYLLQSGDELDSDDRVRLSCRLYEQFIDTPTKAPGEILSHLSGLMDLLSRKRK